MVLLRTSLGVGLALMLFFLPFTVLFDGLGLSRVSHYFDVYHGSLSWAHYRVTFQPQGTGQRPAPDSWTNTLRYGFNLAHHAALDARLLQTDVALAEAGPLLYDTTAFPRGFSPDSVYYAWMGVRGNYLSYPFGARPVAVVLAYRAAAAPAAAPSYPPQPQWSRPLRLYAWVSLTLMLWFGAAAMAVASLPEYRRPADRLAALLLVLVFGAARGYVDWFDYHTGEEWPIFGPLLTLLLLAGYVYQLFQPESSEEAPAAETEAQLP